MGGPGSGRYEHATTPTVRECYQLKAGDFGDAIDAPDGTAVDLSWGEDVNMRAFVENTGESDHADALRFIYTIDPDGDARRHEYRVPFDYTEPNFGGVRPWFMCPECGTRREKIHRPPTAERFACRECFDLGYLTSRRSGDDLKQAELRYRRAFAKADKDNRRPHPNGTPHLPERAKGTHRETFDQLVGEVHEASEEWYDRMRERERELLERLRE
jgi:hypothetical protein